MDERRQNSIEMVLLEIGKLQGMTETSQRRLNELNEKMSIQNGRVSKIEKSESFYKGVITVLSVMLLPIAIKYLPGIISSIINIKGGS